MSNVNLIDIMGSDLSVVNSARVSFSKVHKEMQDNDEKLIKYLATHNHWSPFGHASMQFRIKAPVFVARQLVKHQVGLVWNEVSRRYVDTDPEFYVPFLWREKHENKKQGSTDTEVEYDIMPLIKKAKEMYQDMLDSNIAPELARMILPQCMMTEWIWSGTLYAFARVCNLRNKSDAQQETTDITRDIAHHMKDQFPVSSKYLLEKE
jgi:thymidylate synthase (FAD)